MRSQWIAVRDNSASTPKPPATAVVSGVTDVGNVVQGSRLSTTFLLDFRRIQGQVTKVRDSLEVMTALAAASRRRCVHRIPHLDHFG